MGCLFSTVSRMFPGYERRADAPIILKASFCLGKAFFASLAVAEAFAVALFAVASFAVSPFGDPPV